MHTYVYIYIYTYSTSISLSLYIYNYMYYCARLQASITISQHANYIATAYNMLTTRLI